MAETLPRWGLPEVNFVETDPEIIKSEIITGYETASGRSLADGDPVRLFLLTIADRIIHLQNCINSSAQQNLLTYAQGNALDALGVLLNTERLSPSPALTNLSFKLSQARETDYLIPADFKVTNGTVTFATDEEIIIPAGELYGEVSATCTTDGVVGNNYVSGQITTIVTPMPYLESATNTSTTSGGADEENDEDYAERLKTATDKFSVAGPAAAYKHYAMSANPGIIDVGIISPNPCEIEIYPLMSGGTLPTQDVLDQIADFFAAEDIIPMTDKVTVKAPSTHEYTINVDYYIDSNSLRQAESIRAAVAAAVEEYRSEQQTQMGQTITPDGLIYKVKAAGAAYVDLSTLSPASLVKLDDNVVAQCTGVTVTYKGGSK